MYNIWVPPSNATARNDEQSIWQDSDNDGVMNFDEINRFFTKPNSPDTDGDGIDDKTEIRSYVFLANGTFDSLHTRKPDVDNDTLRAERDWDTDNGGARDGLEDLNRNGVLDPGETDPFSPLDDPYNPLPVASFTCFPSIPWANETVTFNATDGYDSYAWNFDDGNITTSGPAVNHAYISVGNYTVALNVTDNGFWNSASSVIAVTYKVDLNRDKAVNILDIAAVASAYGSRSGDPKWNAMADFDKNGTINILDISMVARDYGKTV